MHLLTENIEILKAVAHELLEKETIMLEDMDRIIEEHRNKEKGAVPGPPEGGESPGEPAQQ